MTVIDTETNCYSIIEKNKLEINELQNNSKSLETFAREKYLMKKDDEDVFVFTTK